MADATELRIVMVGEGRTAGGGGAGGGGVGAIGPPGAPITPQGTPPAATPAPNPPQAPAMQGPAMQGPPAPNGFGPPPSAQVTTYRPGMQPPPVQQASPGAPLNAGRPAGLGNPPTSGSFGGGGGGAALLAAGIALDLFTKAVEFATQVIRAQSVIKQQELRGDIGGAQVTRDRLVAQTLRESGVPGGKTAAAILEGRAQQRENFLQESNLLNERALALSPFNATLARQVAANQIAATQRTIAEAQFAGPRLAEFEQARNEREAVEQQIRAIKEFQEAGRKVAEERKVTRERERVRDDLLRELPEAVAKALKDAFRETRGDPIELLLAGIKMPTAADDDTGKDLLDELVDQQANRPQFGGIPG